MNKIYVIVFFLICSCSNVKEPLYTESNSFEVYDTLTLNYTTRDFKIYDYDENLDLFVGMSRNMMDSIIVFDSNGSIKSKFFALGTGNQIVGNNIYSISFRDKDKLLINSDDGFVTYNYLTDSISQIVTFKNSIRAYGSIQSFNIEQVKAGDSEMYLTILKPSFPENYLRDFDERIITDYKPITAFFPTSGKFEMIGDISKNSIYYSESSHFGELLSLFDYNSEKSLIFLLNNPDNIVLVYDVLGTLIKEIPLTTKEFKLPYSYGFGYVTDNMLEYQVVNSVYREMYSSGSDLLITYRTGIHDDTFLSMSSPSDLPRYFQKEMKYYAILLEDEEQNSEEFELPYASTGIANFNSKNNLLLYTNPSITETTDGMIFFKARIIESK